jgi:GAF domain-containing protein
VRDVSDRQQSVAAPERAIHLFHGFCQWDQTRLALGEPAGPALQALCERLVAQLGYRQCWIGLANAGGTDEYTTVAQAGFPKGRSAPHIAVWAELARGVEPEVLHDLHSDTAPAALRESALAWGSRSLLVAPMTTDDQRIGLLVIFAAEPDAYPPELVSVWNTLSNSLALMIATSSGQGQSSTEGS